MPSGIDSNHPADDVADRDDRRHARPGGERRQQCGHRRVEACSLAASSPRDCRQRHGDGADCQQGHDSTAYWTLPSSRACDGCTPSPGTCRAHTAEGYSGLVQRRMPKCPRRRGVVIGLQIAPIVAFTAVLGWFLRDTWRDAPRSSATQILGTSGSRSRSWRATTCSSSDGGDPRGPRDPDRLGPARAPGGDGVDARQVRPGTVWTPIARILWLRRAGGVTETSVVFGSPLLEAALGRVGRARLRVGLAVIGESSETLIPLTTFAVLVLVLLHLRVFVLLSRARHSPGSAGRRSPSSPIAMLGLLAFYSVSRLVGGVAVLYLARSLGADPGWSSVPYLGGTAAVGAIASSSRSSRRPGSACARARRTDCCSRSSPPRSPSASRS